MNIEEKPKSKILKYLVIFLEYAAIMAIVAIGFAWLGIIVLGARP